METANSGDVDNFKTVFKYFKQKAQAPCYRDVIDFQTQRNNMTINKVPIEGFCNDMGLRFSKSLTVLQPDSIPGLSFICNPFTEEGQQLWSKRCLEMYPLQPSKTNIGDVTHSNDVWKNWCKSVNGFASSKLGNNKGQLQVLKSSPIWKLRWVTLGYHHNWDTKVYSDDNVSLFPPELNQLANVFATAVGEPKYNAEAAIINYYHVGSTLSPHTDHSEKNLKAPLISISFGLPAIFLIGGLNKAQTPQAILIRSGDVIIMSEKSRLSYHAVPRILECDVEKPRYDPKELFLAHSRINMNIRQVLTS
uniref:Alkylated DNA repair protein alkB homolog 1 n=1 Tax=Phallusia mammillata TaxID=59560 RepID=A0A6F9D6T3_9ASCI|nr:alkylated DNA repair protein alkB homolog 1 [Phallusia mammillata]